MRAAFAWLLSILLVPQAVVLAEEKSDVAARIIRISPPGEKIQRDLTRESSVVAVNFLGDEKLVTETEIDLDAVGEDELVGRVVDPDDKPIEGVDVDAWTWYPGNETRTDKQGRFRLKGLGRRQFIEVQFTKANHSPRLFVRQQAGERDWVVIMTDTTLFEGQVRGPDGKPAAGALIRANRGPKRAEGVVITDVWTEVLTGPDGRYRLFVEEDKYDIQVRMTGVGVARLTESIAGDEVRPLDIKLAPGVAFRARVVDSVTGKPVAGVRLWHWQHRGVEGRSNGEGLVAIDDMFPGPFAFQVEADGFARWWSEQAATQWGRRLISAENRGWQRNFDGLDFALEPAMDAVTVTVEQAAVISGRVLDPGGKPVAGATVAPALTGTGNSLTGDTRFSVTTDADGRYKVQLPASGEREYNLVAHDGKFREWRKWANGVSALLMTEPGKKLDDFDISLTRPATVRGRVVDRLGNPVARREVRTSPVDKLENRYYDPSTTTDAEGRFELKFIRPGEQTIQVSPGPGGSQMLELTADEVAEDVELVGEPDRRR